MESNKNLITSLCLIELILLFGFLSWYPANQLLDLIFYTIIIIMFNYICYELCNYFNIQLDLKVFFVYKNIISYLFSNQYIPKIIITNKFSPNFFKTNNLFKRLNTVKLNKKKRDIRHDFELYKKEHFKLIILIQILLSFIICLQVSDLLHNIFYIKFKILTLFWSIATAYFISALVFALMFAKIFSYSSIFIKVQERYYLDWFALIGIAGATCIKHLIFIELFSFPYWFQRLFSLSVELFLLTIFVGYILKNIKFNTNPLLISFRHPDIKIY